MSTRSIKLSHNEGKCYVMYQLKLVMLMVSLLESLQWCPEKKSWTTEKWSVLRYHVRNITEYSEQNAHNFSFYCFWNENNLKSHPIPFLECFWSNFFTFFTSFGNKPLLNLFKSFSSSKEKFLQKMMTLKNNYEILLMMIVSWWSRCYSFTR